MLLYFGVITPEGEERCLAFFDPCINTHLSLLNHLVQVGYQLQFATLFEDETNRISLPIEAFDGEGIVTELKELELAYNQVLSS